MNLRKTKSFEVLDLKPKLVAVIPDDILLDAEANAAGKAGFEVYRFAVLSRSSRSVVFSRLIPLFSCALGIHRGFMLTSESYKMMYDELKSRYNIQLIVSPQAYERCHYFPNAYPFFSHFAPLSIWVPCSDAKHPEQFSVAISKIQNWECTHVMLKDYVKSAKDVSSRFNRVPTGGALGEATSRDAAAEHLAEAACDLILARGARFNRGVVFKEYVDMKQYTVLGSVVFNEWRVFFCSKGRVLAVLPNSYQAVKDSAFTMEQPLCEIELDYMNYNCGRTDADAFIRRNIQHWCEPDLIIPHDVALPCTEILDGLQVVAQSIGSPYMTIDIAEASNGKWFVLEAGDGGVSGPTPYQNLEEHWRSLLAVAMHTISC